MFSDSEFQTLREELDHLGSAQVRLGAMEKIWVQATSARDFDRRVREEFGMSEDDLSDLKDKLLGSGTVLRPMGATRDPEVAKRIAAVEKFQLPGGRRFLNDAQRIGANDRVDERLKWYVFLHACLPCYQCPLCVSSTRQQELITFLAFLYVLHGMVGCSLQTRAKNDSRSCYYTFRQC